MKKTIGLVMGIVLLSLSVGLKAQQTWDPKKNPTVTAITSQYEGKLLPPRAPVTVNQIFPVLGKYESTNNTISADVTPTTTDVTATTPATATSLSITLDEQNKGLVWIEGLPQGRLKAMLRKSPATYKIPAQTTADGKEVPEGVMIFDPEDNSINICLGCTYNLENPAVAFQPAPIVEEPVVIEKPVKKSKKVKTKVVVEEKPKPWFYSGTKVPETTTGTDTVVKEQQ